MVENLTVVIPFYQGHSYLRRLIESLPASLPVIVVDDMSDPPLQREDWMRENIKILRLRRKGYFAGAVNVGTQSCKTDVLVLNQDVWFSSNDWLDILSQRNKYAFIGERIRGNHPSFGDFGYIHGTFMFMRRDAIDIVGPLNEKDYPLWGNTAEWQWRVARKGFQVLPLTKIPGFNHERPVEERFGSSISHLLTLESDKKSKLIATPPLLSVIVPCYNYGRFLQDCVNSLIGGKTSLGHMPGQTLQSMEIIIVDDASVDETPSVMAEIVDIKKGIRGYRLEENQGTAKTLNYGIERANGKYITFLSADDMREPESLETLVKACEANPHTFAYDDIWLFVGNKRVRQWPMDDYDFERLIYKNHVHAGIVYPKAAWTEVGGYPGIMDNGREDWAFNVALGIHGWCGHHVRQFGYLYRREGQNRSLRNTSPENHAIFQKKIAGLFPEVYRGERPMACCGKGGRTSQAVAAQKSANSLARKTQVFSGNMGGAVMTASAGSAGFVKLLYTGKGMSSVYDGPVTNTRYRFGSDRPKGWVDKRDAGERGKNNTFLNLKKSDGGWLFEVVEDGDATAKKTETKIENVTAQPVKTAKQNVVDIQKDPIVVVSDAPKEEKKLDFPNPSELNASEIRGLTLTKEQWRAVYEAELADKNRKSVVTYIEEQLASD